MKNLSKNIVKILTKNKQTISCMESCTGGSLANEITNNEGASKVLKLSLITYSNESKVKFGVDKKVINKYSVYSKNTAVEMAKNACIVAEADWGIGITGEIGEQSNNKVYYAIFNKKTNKFIVYNITAEENTREKKKDYIIQNILQNFLEQITNN